VFRVSRLSTAVATVAGRPLFINGEPVFAFTHARLPAITHQRHARARVPRALPAAAPRRECIVVKVIAIAGPLSRAEDPPRGARACACPPVPEGEESVPARDQTARDVEESADSLLVRAP